MAEEVEDIKETIDKWLFSVPKVSCYRERLKIFAPTCDDKCLPAVQELINKVNTLFGGSTIYDQCTGCWFDEEKEAVLCEPVKVIEVGHNCSTKEDLTKLMAAITDYAVKTDQHSMSIQNGRFYITKRPELVKKYEELVKELP